ncbi:MULTISPECIES: DUF6479 family protein [unclassified Streptomyces]|uniref:DUF6479 family protein n=1 Tax=Streptomyces evansiae TaxID=3075535 RepID=A0ABD5E2L1_9ACTN|nr:MULTISPECIES: DUF6479 family protein [unclassified Streptomyces]ASY36369.1 hypothetical protein CAC01_29770 [Streptomyces sp. CLI2509]EFK98164.1 conserved hypothetical protein [Streptomyces sp. SPB78]MDT0409125.1 DUF6479 family protein [Streptomyces sp. DSM 41979]MDT0415512.1 DUF6479 family protein [Streptomyces sp. DSM 41982]MDT0424230.1 DUF6479 family protein [Streptomyces sp. DSM 41859]
MDTTQWNLAANSAAIIMPVIGVFVVAALIAAFAYGRRLRARQPAPPKPDEQPHLPEGGPIGEERELREPDEMEPREARLTPHELNGGGTGQNRRSPSQKERKWDENSSGGFGSGGFG